MRFVFMICIIFSFVGIKVAQSQTTQIAPEVFAEFGLMSERPNNQVEVCELNQSYIQRVFEGMVSLTKDLEADDIRYPGERLEGYYYLYKDKIALDVSLAEEISLHLLIEHRPNYYAVGENKYDGMVILFGLPSEDIYLMIQFSDMLFDEENCLMNVVGDIDRLINLIGDVPGANKEEKIKNIIVKMILSRLEKV